MFRNGFSLFLLLMATTGALGRAEQADNLGKEKLNANQRKAYLSLQKFLRECSLAPSLEVSRVETSKGKLKATDLANAIKSKIKNAFTDFPSLRDDEVFKHVDQKLPEALLTSVHLSDERNGHCRKQIESLQKEYEVAALPGKKGNKGRVQVVYGVVLQAELGGAPVQFYLLTHRYEEIDREKIILETDPKKSVRNYQVKEKTLAFESDRQLREFFEKGDAEVNFFVRWQLAEARSVLIQVAGAEGQKLAKGEYLEDKGTQWHVRKVIQKEGPQEERWMVQLNSPKKAGSYSVFFYPSSDRLDYVVQEGK